MCISSKLYRGQVGTLGIKSSSALLLLVISLTSANADQYHYNNILIGDRASGMGGAYTAVSDDPSGLYYNPSGIAFMSGASISGSMNAFHITKTEYKNVLGGDSWTRKSSTLTPNFFGAVQPFAGGMIGFSWAVPDVILEDQDQEFSNFTTNGGVLIKQYNINFNNQDTTYNIGPTFAYKLGQNLSLGATLYGYYRRQERILNQQVYFDKIGNRWTNQYFESTEYGINPVIGIMWSPRNKLSLGINLRKPYVLSSQTRLQNTVQDINDTTLGLPNIVEQTDKRKLPYELDFGTAYFANEKLLISADIHYFQKLDERLAVLNWAVGTEYYISSNWALRLGTYSNYANTPSIVQGQNNQQEHIDLIGASTSLSHFTRNSSISLGFSWSGGNGKAQVIDDGTIQKVTAHTTTLFFSAVYSY